MSIDLVTIHIKHTRSAPTNKSQNRGLSLTLHKRMLHVSNHNWGNHQQLLACLLHVLGSGIWECSCFILATAQPELSPPLKALRGLFGSSLSQMYFPLQLNTWDDDEVWSISDTTVFCHHTAASTEPVFWTGEKLSVLCGAGDRPRQA